MLEFHPENFRHACESSDQDAQLYAFWTHSRTGMAAARAGDAATVDSCRRALLAMIDFFEGLPVAHQASLSIRRMESTLQAQTKPKARKLRRAQASNGNESA
jgi:hypothetical protein